MSTSFRLIDNLELKMSHNKPDVGVWVIDQEPAEGCLERLGDARRIANALGTQVGILLIEPRGNPLPELAVPERIEDRHAASITLLVQHGADQVLLATANQKVRSESGSLGPDATLATMSKVDTTIDALTQYQVQIVFAGGDPASREWAAMLAAKNDWMLVSPALMVEYRRGRLIVTRVDHTGRRSRQTEVTANQRLVLAMRAGVAEACAADSSRRGAVETVAIVAEDDRIQSRILPGDPATGDIRDIKRLVAGGRGLGSREGFDLLRDVADSLAAGVAASRMAVDLGWIEYDRQVGQTGKTVEPDLYIACGISGASHHLQGIVGAKHIIAINSDANAPIMKTAQLGLAADLYPVLQSLKQRLKN